MTGLATTDAPPPLARAGDAGARIHPPIGPSIHILRTTDSSSFRSTSGTSLLGALSGGGGGADVPAPATTRSHYWRGGGGNAASSFIKFSPSLSLPRRYRISDSAWEGARILWLCLLWYTFSALTSNLGKAILTAYKWPVTLTYVQFGFVCLFCYAFSGRMEYRIVRPTRAIARKIIPISVFLIAGHILSSMAISSVPVSLVQTIKTLSPLVTVFFSAYFLQVEYEPQVYLSLLPLTLGVALICVRDFSVFTVASAYGAFLALLSTVVFVLQTLVTKALLLHQQQQQQQEGSITGSHGSLYGPPLDTVNMLFYCSFFSFLLMTPLWLYSEGVSLLRAGRAPSLHVTYLLTANGVTHFLQNIFSFWMLSLVSPVAYSIASLAKRIFVILAAFVSFGEHLTLSQGVGFVLTGYGLWLYNHSKHLMHPPGRRLTGGRTVSVGRLLPTHHSPHQS